MKRIATAVAVAYFVAMTAALTFPGLAIANRVEPVILGMPFLLVWFLAWIAGSLLVFLFLHLASEP